MYESWILNFLKLARVLEDYVSLGVLFLFLFFSPNKRKSLFSSRAAQKQAEGGTWPWGCRWLTPGLEGWIEVMEVSPASLFLPSTGLHNLPYTISETSVALDFKKVMLTRPDQVLAWSGSGPNSRLGPKSFATLAGFQGAAFRCATVSPASLAGIIIDP